MASTVPNPPYNGENTTFKNPLQAGYRAKMLTWLNYMFQDSAAKAAAAGISYTIPNESAKSDSDVTKDYVTAWHIWNATINTSPDAQPGHISALDPISNPVNAVVDTAVAIPDFLGKLTSTAFLVRVVEVVLGLGLIWVGLSKLTDGKLPMPPMSGNYNIKDGPQSLAIPDPPKPKASPAKKIIKDVPK